MEKNITLSAGRQHTGLSWKQMARIPLWPIERLRRYYTQVMEREVTLRQTGLLINAQLAFATTVFPVEAPLTARIICCTWLLHALLKCKQAF